MARLREGDERAREHNRLGQPIGLALSGGGIRSATICLGALQALAENRLLRRFDYLSTVSGGGYIGAWFSAMLRGRHQAAQDALAAGPTLPADPIGEVEKLISPSEIRKQDEEPAELAFLRAYSNYLTPRLGLFSADTLAALTGYLRNLFLSLLLAVFSMGVVLGVLHLLMMGVAFDARQPQWRFVAGWSALGLLGLGALLASLLLTLQSLDIRTQITEGSDRNLLLAILRLTQDLFGKIMLPLLAGGLVLGGIWLEISLPFTPLAYEIFAGGGATLLLFGLGAYMGYFLIDLAQAMRAGLNSPAVARSLLQHTVDWQALLAQLSWDNRREVLRYTIATAACAFVAYQLIAWCGSFAAVHPVLALFRGPGLAVLIACMVLMVWLGAVGTTYSELTREWISRLLGTLVGATLAWLLAGAILVNARPLMAWLAGGTWLVAFQAAWIVPTAGLLLLATLVAQRRPVSGDPAPGLRAWLMRAAVPVACGVVTLLFVAAMTVAFQEVLVRIAGASALRGPGLGDAGYAGLLDAHLADLRSAIDLHEPSAAFPAQWSDWAGAIDWIRAVWTAAPVVSLLVACAIGAVFAFRYIDVNVFSLQNLYRNRLVRCYLGAARHETRLQDPYAGFDPQDDVELASLATQRPYPLINTALNITQGDDLAWQQRKAASFCFSPLWSGYWLEAPNLSGIVGAVGETRTRGGYARTEDYAIEPTGRNQRSDGVMLGTAMATSGAAVSSQMGFASQGLLAFVLTLFNVRLGRWFPNTTGARMSQNLGRHSPRFAGIWYLSELLGRTNEKSDWIYLSDGGHFDNLGVYELVRRRCRFIIAIDAGADPKMSFGDLGNCVRKCRVDFGVGIRIDLDAFAPAQGSKRPAVSHVMGKVHYPRTGDLPPFTGDILYIKSSIPASADQLPADILSFLAEHPQFPHQPTSDQWFTESQFESYRQLGYSLAKLALPAAQAVFGAIERPSADDLRRAASAADGPAPRVESFDERNQ